MLKPIKRLLQAWEGAGRLWKEFRQWPCRSKERQRGVTAELARYPREGHGFHEPRHLLDQRRRTVDWMDRFLQNKGSSVSQER